jgi:hypothetical protein
MSSVVPGHLLLVLVLVLGFVLVQVLVQVPVLVLWLVLVLVLVLCLLLLLGLVPGLVHALGPLGLVLPPAGPGGVRLVLRHRLLVLRVPCIPSPGLPPAVGSRGPGLPGCCLSCLPATRPSLPTSLCTLSAARLYCH